MSGLTYYERDTCRLCLGSLSPAFSLPPTPIANAFSEWPDSDAARFPLDLLQCDTCGNVQMKLVFRGLFEDYKYVTPGSRHQADLAAYLWQRFPSAESALEIGSNNGSLVEALRLKGFRCTGVDPAAPQRPGQIRDYFTAKWARRWDRTVDLVIANNVLAHIDDLEDVFRGIKRVLTSRGAVVFEVQYLVDLIESGKFDMIYHEHMNYHTLGALSRFLTRMGFVLVEWQHLPEHGGSIRVTAMRTGTSAVLPDEPLCWDRLRTTLTKVHCGLHAAIARHGPLVAFGASAKACTLIHCTEIAPHITYCVDDTPEKQGRYLPGTDILVRPVSVLRDEPVLLTAWNYEGIIRERISNRLINPFGVPCC